MIPMLALAVPALAEEPLTRAELDSVLTFRQDHLQIREIHTVVPGTMTFVRSGWGWGPRPWLGYGWGTTDVITTPPEVLHSWTVYQGPQSLNVPDFLRAIGKEDEANALISKVDSAHATSATFRGIGAVGLAAAIAGTVGTFVAPPDQQLAFAGVGLGGLGTAAIGFAIGGGEAERARRLAHDFPKTQDLPTVEGEVRDYNEQLRTDLGLTPEQAYRELEPPARRRP